MKTKRWNVVAIIDNKEVSFVVRGNTKEAAKANAFNNYKGVTSIVSLTERTVRRTHLVSEKALRYEPYQFKLRNETKPRGRRE